MLQAILRSGKITLCLMKPIALAFCCCSPDALLRKKLCSIMLLMHHGDVYVIIENICHVLRLPSIFLMLLIDLRERERTPQFVVTFIYAFTG